MSEGVDDSAGAALHITLQGGEKAEAVCPDGARTFHWDHRSKQDTGRATACTR